LPGKSKVNRVLLLIGVVSQEAVRTGAPERTSRTLHEPSGIPRGDILAARTDGPIQDQGSQP
jgi:hypothetical protein